MNNGRKRIVLVSPDYPPPVSGGSLVYFYNLVENCPDSIDILTAPLPQGLKEISSPRHRVIRSPFLVASERATGSSLFCMYLYLFIWALKIAMLRRYDVVVFFTSAIGNGFFSALFSLLGVKIVCFVLAEEIPLARKAPGWKGALKRLCLKGYPKATAFFSNCHFATGLLTEMGVGLERICDLPTPIYLGKFDALAKVAPKSDSHEILTVGRLVKRKGAHLVVDAVDLLRKEIPDIHFTIVGDGPEMGPLQDQVKSKGLEAHVTFTGPVFDDRKLSRFYQKCDLFILANMMLEDGNCEGTPNVCIEASAHYKPVIAGIEGGTSSAVKDRVSGYLINPRDVPNMARVIKSILLDRDLAARLGAGGRKKVEEEHDPVKAGQKFSAFLGDVITGLKAASNV